MDPITHGLLGSNIGQSLSKRYLSIKTIVIAGLVAMSPDLDIFFSNKDDPLSGLVIHRGITHSLFFGPVVAPLLGYIISRFSPTAQKKEDFFFYTLLCFLALESHVLLDLCTSYGTQIFAPFSNLRLAIDVVAVVDPFYTLPLLVSFVLGLYFTKHNPQKALLIGRLTLLLSTGLLFIFYHINQTLVTTAQSSLNLHENTPYVIKSYPTLLQPFYRRITAESSQKQCVTHISLFKTHRIHWRCYPKTPHWAIDALEKTYEARVFKWFAMDQVVFELSHPTPETIEVIMSDLRYSQPDGKPLWGIRQLFDKNNTPVKPPLFFSAPMSFKLSLVRDMWHAAFN